MKVSPKRMDTKTDTIIKLLTRRGMVGDKGMSDEIVWKAQQRKRRTHNITRRVS